MPKHESHPSVEDLAAFSVGQLSSIAAANVEDHIGECKPCSDTLIGLSNEDTFLALLKESARSSDDLTIDLAGGESESSTASVLAEHSRYEISERIARGGMGEVFKAKHRMMERTVALKVIKKGLMQNAEAVERFHREVKTAARLSHPNIVTAYDAEQADDIHFLVMEFVDGVNLADLIKSGETLSVENACDYVSQAAIGLQHAHQQGMVHRDMKPHNLMLTSDGTVKILDFGLASLTEKTLAANSADLPENAELTAVGAIMGTPDFISPEQATDARQADIRSDIYSLGATLHFLLSGQPPFAGGSVSDKLKKHAEAQPEPLSRVRDDVSADLSCIIDRMMAKDPDNRFQAPQDVADALEAFTHPRKSVSVIPTDQPQTSRTSWWPPTGAKTLACAAFAFILAGIIYVETDKGTLKIESMDDNVEVFISQDKGDAGDSRVGMKVVDTVTGSAVKRLPSGEYKLTLGKEGNEFELSQGGFTLSRGGDVIVKVTRKSGVTKQPDAHSVLPMTLPASAQQSVMMQGMRLSATEASELQKTLDANPRDIQASLQLMAYYGRNSIMSHDLRQPHQDLVMWIVKNYPKSKSAGDPSAHIHASMNPGGYVAVKKVWLEKVESHDDNVTILSNAASFFKQSDREIAEQLLKKAVTLEPENPDVAQQLGQLYKLGLISATGKQRRELASKAMAQFESAVKLDTRRRKNHYWLADLAKVALDAGADEKAKQYATQLLKTSTSGNAIHDGNLVLGRLALKAGHIDTAKSHLLKSADNNGSPNLSSFGPNMILAKELLDIGEKEVVLEYFKLCSEFWKKDILQEWTEIVNQGGTPNFGGNLNY